MEVEIRATREQIEEFKESVLWEDIRRELGQWKRMCQGEYGQVVGDCIDSGPVAVEGQVVSDRPNNATVLMHLGSLYGRERSVDYFVSILDVFLQILEDKEDAKRKQT